MKRIAAIGVAMIPAAVLLVGVVAALIVVHRNSTADKVFGQPRVERAAQMRLPHSGDPIWATLGRTAISEDAGKGVFKARYPAAVKSLAGKDITVAGYLLPLEAKGASDHFLLSKYTPVCPFCPPGRPNEVIEVRAASPIIPDTAQIRLTGRFTLQQDGEAGLFFRLDQAVVTD